MKKTFKFTNKQAFSLFRFFLKRNNAYDSFVENFPDSRPFSYFDWFEHTDPSCYILFAFLWKLTPEGLEYWDDLNDKWEVVLKFFKF